MTPAALPARGCRRRASSPRAWAMWSTPRSAWAFLLFAELSAIAISAVLLAGERPSTTIVFRFALLAGLSIGYSETAARSTRLQRYLGSDKIFANPMSVWSYAALLTIPAGWAAMLIATQYAHSLWQRRRDASGTPHRVIFTAAATILAQLTAAVVVDAGGGRSGLHGQVLAQLAALVGVPLFLAVNLAVLVSGMWLTVRPATIRVLVPDVETLGYELCTLVLGLVAGQVVLHSVVLTPVVLALTVQLHRASVVKSLQKLARTDPKTGLLTAAAWTESADAALRRAERSGSGFAVLLVDLDHFKAVNDSHGHLVGDRVLAGVADCLRAELRGHDSIGRFGGEEYVVALEGVSRAVADRVANRLRVAIADLTVDTTVRVTASIGLAYVEAASSARTSVSSLLQQADLALYAAKAAGRNQVQRFFVDGSPAAPALAEVAR
jgi:diguanylate cyclase (GGDEF)-like protein